MTEADVILETLDPRALLVAERLRAELRAVPAAARPGTLPPRSFARRDGPAVFVPTVDGKSYRLLAAPMRSVIFDLVGMAAGYVFAHRVSGAPLHGGGADLPVFVGFTITYLFAAGHGRAYADDARGSLALSLARSSTAFLLLAYVFGGLALLAGASGERTHGLLFLMAPAVGVGLALGRLLSAADTLLRTRRGQITGPVTLVLIDKVGDMGAAGEVAVPGGAVAIDAHALGLRPDADDPLALEALGRAVGGADRVIVACRAERRSDWSLALKGANVDAEVFAHELENLAPMGMGRFLGQATVKVSAVPLTVRDRVIKRLFDLLVASAALVLVSPLLVMVAIAIKIDSPGPIFFRQRRIGRGNRIFHIHKFRSMRSDAEDPNGNTLTTGKHDDRVTRVGRFIRATSIDELPQIIDVLRGRMSIVGPRPHALGARAGGLLYWHVDPAYWHRHAVKPGMTGLAQVRGFRGTTFESQDLANRLQSDLEYLDRWTISKDISILLSTFRIIMGSTVF